MTPRQKELIAEKRAREAVERQAADYLEQCGFDWHLQAGSGGMYYLSEHDGGDWLDGGRLFKSLPDAADYIRTLRMSGGEAPA